MNKEVINKYKDVFDHWLDGGRVCIKTPGNDWFCPKQSDSLGWDCIDDIYIKNDEYVEFRKAQADGKVIQYNPIMKKCHDRWNDIILDSCPSGSLENYRIKPDKPKFKVGDWVIQHYTFMSGNLKEPRTHIKQVKWVVDDSIGFTDDTYRYFSTGTLELWQPKEGEYIFESIFGLCKVISNTPEEGIEVRECFNSKQLLTTIINDCEPFIGTLPSTLKDS